MIRSWRLSAGAVCFFAVFGSLGAVRAAAPLCGSDPANACPSLDPGNTKGKKKMVVTAGDVGSRPRAYYVFYLSEGQGLHIEATSDDAKDGGRFFIGMCSEGDSCTSPKPYVRASPPKKKAEDDKAKKTQDDKALKDKPIVLPDPSKAEIDYHAWSDGKYYLVIDFRGGGIGVELTATTR